MIKNLKFIPFLFLPAITMGVDECEAAPVADGDINPGIQGRVFSMLTTCEVGTVEDIVMPVDSLVVSVLNVSSRDAPSDGGPAFDLLEPMSAWAQSTGRFLNVTCETEEILIFYMEE